MTALADLVFPAGVTTEVDPESPVVLGQARAGSTGSSEGGDEAEGAASGDGAAEASSSESADES